MLWDKCQASYLSWLPSDHVLNPVLSCNVRYLLVMSKMISGAAIDSLQPVQGWVLKWHASIWIHCFLIEVWCRAISEKDTEACLKHDNSFP
jgi:hypothetical protein